MAVIALATAVGGGTALGQSFATARPASHSVASAKLAGPGNYQYITPSEFENGWTFYPKSNGYGRARFYKDSVGIVHLEGVIFGGGGNNNAFLLPRGFRPLVAHAFIVAATTGDGFVDVDVYATGQVFINGTGDPASLDGISFRTR